MTIIGADLGGTKLATALFADDGSLLQRDSADLAGRTGPDVAMLLFERLGQLSPVKVDAVGVCVPGIYRVASGTVWAPNIPGWDNFPLRDALRTALGDKSRIVIDSDRSAYIMGESWCGASKGSRNAIYLAVGTGIGAGILVDGRIVRGHADVAGAIGWLALQRPYDPRWQSYGSFEYQASGPGLVRVARDMLADTPDYSGELLPTPEQLTAADVFAAAEREDPIAVRVIENAIELWAMAAANLVSLFNPEIIVFGGGVFGPGIKFLDRLHTEAQRWAQPIAIEQVRFVGSALGTDAGLYGAARLAATTIA
jgi:glucokinase